MQIRLVVEADNQRLRWQAEAAGHGRRHRAGCVDRVARRSLVLAHHGWADALDALPVRSYLVVSRELAAALLVIVVLA